VTLFFTVLSILVVGLVVGVAFGRIGGGLEPESPRSVFRGLPPGDLTPGDLDEVKFTTALRGYRMDEVDQVLDRLRDELRRNGASVEPGHEGAPVSNAPAEREG
jgi:DivIVA domain-containing protein